MIGNPNHGIGLSKGNGHQRKRYVRGFAAKENIGKSVGKTNDPTSLNYLSALQAFHVTRGPASPTFLTMLTFIFYRASIINGRVATSSCTLF